MWPNKLKEFITAHFLLELVDNRHIRDPKEAIGQTIVFMEAKRRVPRTSRWASLLIISPHSNSITKFNKFVEFLAEELGPQVLAKLAKGRDKNHEQSVPV